MHTKIHSKTFSGDQTIKKPLQGHIIRHGDIYYKRRFQKTLTKDSIDENLKKDNFHSLVKKARNNLQNTIFNPQEHQKL